MSMLIHFVHTHSEHRVVSRQLCIGAAHYANILARRFLPRCVGGDGLDPFQWQTQIPLSHVQSFLFHRGVRGDSFTPPANDLSGHADAI